MPDSRRRQDDVPNRRENIHFRDKFRVFVPVLVTVPALIVLTLSFYLAAQQLEQAAKTSLVATGKKILTETERLLDPAAFAVNANAVWLKTMLGHDRFDAGFYEIARKQMAFFPHYDLIYFGDAQGNHWSIRKMPDGTPRMRLIRRLDDSPDARAAFEEALHLPKESSAQRTHLAQVMAPLARTTWYTLGAHNQLVQLFQDPLKVYDPRLRPWYQGAQHTGKTFWTDVYTWENMIDGKRTTQFGITVSTPVIQEGHPIGVTGVDVVIESISNFLAGLEISAHGRAFIIDSHGRVVGLPDFSDVLQESHEIPGRFERANIHNNRDRAKVAAYHALRHTLNLQTEQPLAAFDKKIVYFEVDDEQFFGFFQPLDPAYQLDWYVGVLMPEEDIKGPLKAKFRWVIVVVAIIVVLILLLTSLYWKVDKERQFIRGAFSKYVSPNRVDFLLKNPQHLTLGGEYRTCSFVMTDLVGFTETMEQVGEQNDPSIIVETLNEYLEGMVRIAFKHEGTLDRIVGDAVAILFSAPVIQDDHAERALRCALEMDRFATHFSERYKQQGIPFGYTRIGVNSGRVLLGNFGGKIVFDYRALGDPINTASRLESINSQIGTRVLVSGETVTRLRIFHGRKVGHLIFKGKQRSVTVYEPLSEDAHASPHMQAYEAAYALMAQENPSAQAAFAYALEHWPTDPLLRFHHERLVEGERGDTIVFTRK